MTQRTRYFLLGSALVVVVGLCTGLVAYYNGALPRLPPSQDSELAYHAGRFDGPGLRRRPGDHELGVPPEAPRRSCRPATRRTAPATKSASISSRTSTSWSPASRATSVQRRRLVVVFAAGSTTASIETTAVQHGATAEDYHGKRTAADARTARHASGRGPRRRREACARSCRGASSSLGCWRSATAARSGRRLTGRGTKADITKNAELMKLVNDVRSGANAWVVGRFDEFSKHASLPDEVKAHLPARAVRRRERARERRRQRHAPRRDARRAGRAGSEGRRERRARRRAARGRPGSACHAVLNSLQVGGADKTVTLSLRRPARSARCPERLRGQPARASGRSRSSA